jgi:HD-like signal output (HDOD) protein
MWFSTIVVAAGLAGLAAWMAYRRGRRPARDSAAAIRATTEQAPASPGPTSAAEFGSNSGALALANAKAAERLWRLAFTAPTHSADLADPTLGIAHRRVQANVTAILQVDRLDPAFFPRRPALMPQLLQAVDDPRVESDKLSRIIAHDPVLAADVLRLANSSLYRASAGPIETIQRAVVVCGVDALRGMLAAAMLRPVFRATRKNFPRLPRLLWERTERASRAAGLYVMATGAQQDRFEAQFVVLLAALGPLVVYSAALDVYSRNPHLTPSGELCVDLIVALAPGVSAHIARHWQVSPRLQAALENGAETLATARCAGELLGTLSLLESQTLISGDERLELVQAAGLPTDLATDIGMRIRG